MSLSSNRDGKLTLLRDLSENHATARLNWQKTIVEYTGRALTVLTDRLLAISGIAEAYAAIFKDQYLAGIWRSQLPAALLWEVTTKGVSRGPYRAPSWSWASIDGTVEYFGDSLAVDPNLQIVAHESQLEEARSPFGAVLSGYLSLKGMLRPLRWDGIKLSPHKTPSDSYLASTNLDAIEEDLSSDGSKIVDVWCLQLSPFQESTCEGPSGLILAKNENGTFRRLGCFIYADSMLDLIDPEERNVLTFAKLVTQQWEWEQSCSLEDVMLV